MTRPEPAPLRLFFLVAVISLLPFVAVHTLLFFTMPWPIALAAIGLSVVLSWPLSQQYELGARQSGRRRCSTPLHKARPN